MGVDYTAVIAIGLEFYAQEEAENFVIENGIVTKEEIEESEGLDEFLCSSDVIGGGCLNLYLSDYYYVGYDISVRDPESFQKSFADAMERWKKLFPNIRPDVIKTVRVS